MPVLHLQKCRSSNPSMETMKRNHKLYTVLCPFSICRSVEVAIHQWRIGYGKSRFPVDAPPYPRIMSVSHMVMERYPSFYGESSRQIPDGNAPQTTGKQPYNGLIHNNYWINVVRSCGQQVVFSLNENRRV